MSQFKKILNLGTAFESNPLKQEYIRITNSINVLYILGLSFPLIVATLFVTHDGINSYSRYIVLIAFSSFSCY